ncbi:MAG TPA: hypothetical protein VIR02_06890 [Anaerolineales bacterium]
MEYSTTQQRIAAIGHEPVLKKSTFVFALAIFGVFSALAGIMSLTTAIMLPSDTSLWTDAVYGFSLAALIFASARTFTRGKILSVWLYGSSILLDILYNLATGNPLNYLFIGFGLLLVWQILKFRNRLELV